MVKVKFLYT